MNVPNESPGDDLDTDDYYFDVLVKEILRCSLKILITNWIIYYD